MRTNRKKGFTITELVIVIAVIAVLAAVLIPTFASVVSSAHESAAMQNCTSALTSYRALEGVGGDVDPGIVLVNNEKDNEYAYVFLGGSLQKIDKIEKIAFLEETDDSSNISGKVPSVFKFKKEDGTEESDTFEHQGKGYLLAPTIGEEQPTSSQKIDLTEQKEGETGKETVVRGKQNLYFYEVKVEGETYFGYFTLEQDFDNAKNTLEEGAVIYSDQFGYVTEKSGQSIIFSDEKESTEAGS